MRRSVTVYVADEKLKLAAKGIIDATRQMTGDTDTEVKVEIDTIGGGTSQPWNGNFSNTGFVTTTTAASSLPSNYMGTTTGVIPPNSNSFYIQTPSTTNPTWSQTYPNYINVPAVPAVPMTPDQVPSSELFEQMLTASIKQLNEAYNLGRVHGFIEGKKNGGDEVRKEIGNALDCDPLTYAEDSSLGGTTSSPTV
jgi:hypothetical protein